MPAIRLIAAPAPLAGQHPPTAPQIELSATGWSKEDVTVTVSGGSDEHSGVAGRQYKLAPAAGPITARTVVVTAEGKTMGLCPRA